MSTPPVKRACDACHRRKVRCTGGQPCRNCGQASLQCTYNAIPQKKGPKGSRAKVISELRDTQQQQQHQQHQQQQQQQQQQANLAEKVQHYSIESSPFDFNSPPTSPNQRREGTLLSQAMVDSCVDFFFVHMYPTMPIFHRQRLMEMLAAGHDLSPEVHCLAAALCAFIMVQPGMPLLDGYGVAADSAQGRYEAALALLDEVSRIRKDYDYIENPSVLSVQISFFLFGSYFGLEKQNTAWFHLREASTLAQIIGMHEESSYMMGDPVDNIYRRRLYWLLLVTERAYAMERHRPLSLHATIELPFPDEIPSDDAVVTGFLHLISLFRLFDDDFIGLWNKARSDCSTTWLASLQQQLSDALPRNFKSTASQAVDIRVSQQWLRTMVWQLSITNGYLSSSSPDSSMTFKYPIEIAKDLIRDINALPLQSMEVHGVGLIEKLFDVACTLTDVIACVPLENGMFGDIPSDCLNQFLDLISRLRGGGSRYLPLLIAKISENLPSMAAPVNHMPLSIKSEYSESSSLSPTVSARSAPGLRPSPMSPYGHPASAVSDPSMTFAGYSPSASDCHTPTSTSQVAAPIPRSMPRIQFDGYGS